MAGESGVPGPPTEQAPPPPVHRQRANASAAPAAAVDAAPPSQAPGKLELLARQRNRSQSLSIRLSSQRKRTASAMTASASVSSTTVSKNKSQLSHSEIATPDARSVSDSETGAEWDEFGIAGSVNDEEVLEEDEFTNVPAFFLHRYNPLQVETRPDDGTKISNWRVVNRVRTVGIALVLALNLTVAPPDAPPSPRPQMECWMEPPRRRQDKGIELVAANLQAQYLKWDPRAMSKGASRGRAGIRVKQCLDPTQEDVKRMCMSLRQYAHTKRLIFHYNGHGAPRPTDNGELWLFNRDITQYIPLSLYDLQSWVRTPTVFVFECSQAGLLVKWLRRFAEQRQAEHHRVRKEDDSGARPKLPSLMNDFLAVAACSKDEMLPANPGLPADLFSCCLTTPIKAALYWASKRSMLLNDLPEGQSYEELLDDIPGSIDDRTSPLGELTWMFTAITDTIAWQVLPPNLFQELFRQDSVVASLFRNFLLAERIMSYHHCTPVSHPALPRSSQHPMWQTWDQITDIFLEQLPHLRTGRHYQPSKFFSEQLMAFDVWLDFADSKKAKSRPPEQLPILLQAMLSPQHRLNALTILCRFLDLGSWAVDLSLTVGVFHYVLQLLQKANATTVGILVFIWAKLLAVDSSCQVDLIKSKSHVFFIRVLDDHQAGGEDGDYEALSAEEKARAHRVLIDRRVRAAFALSVMMNQHSNGQKVCYHAGIMRVCIGLLQDKNALLRRWALICLAKVWESNEELKRLAMQDYPNVTDHVCSRITDGSSGVRTAALYALGTFIITGQPHDSLELNLAFSLRLLSSDTNPMVRSELICTLSMAVSAYERKFVKVVLASARQETNASLSDQDRAECRAIVSSEYGRLWRSLYSMQSDPMPELVKQANRAVIAIHTLAASSVMVDSRGNDESAEQMHAYLMQVAALQTKKKSRPRLPPDNPLNKSGSRVDNLKSKFNGWRKSMRVSSSALGGPASPNLARRAGGVSGSEPTMRSISMQAPPPPAAAASAAPKSREDPGLGQSSPAVVLSQGRGGTFQPDKSRFFHWCCEQFRNTLLEADIDPTAPAQRTKEWKVKQHQKMLHTVSSIKEELATSKLETQVAILQGESTSINQLLVHPCFPAVVSTNDSDVISVYDWQTNTSLNTFSNTNPSGTFISSLSFVNIFEEYDLLMVGASDGVIRVWRMYHSAADCGLHTAWIAHKQPQNSAGLKLLWNQTAGSVLTAGEYPVMRLWDVERGIAVQDIPTNSTSCVTTMSIDKPKGNVVLLGFQDGTVRLFDCRMSAKSSLLQSYSEHKRQVLKVELMYQSHKFVSGSTGGDVKFWDLRMPTSINTIQAHSKSDMASLAVHQHIPLIATGTKNQTIKILNHQGQRVNDIKYYSKFLGQRIGAVTCLEFHPFRGLLAAGGGDSVVALYRSTGVRATTAP